jgi:hypothetical protein
MLEATQPPDGPSPLPPRQTLPEEIYSLYSGLAQSPYFHAETGLGGRLLYGGDIRGKALIYASNIAGAASLAASADAAEMRQAMREGVIDFMVTSLEEALRILKNEVRKHQAVAVGVAVAPELLVAQMIDRGVLPDILPDSDAMDLEQLAWFLGLGATRAGRQAGHGFLCWSVDRDFARWLPRLDALAQAIIPPEDAIRHRWLRLAPRYLGRLAQREHGAGFTEAEEGKFRAAIRELVEQECGENPDFEVKIAGHNPG